MGLDQRWEPVVESFAAAALSLASDVERFRDGIGEGLDAGRHRAPGERLEFEVTLELSLPGLEDVAEQTARILGMT